LPTDLPADLTIEVLRHDEADLVEQTFDLLVAAHAVDTPENPSPTKRPFVIGLGYPPPDAEERHYAAVEDGRVVGWCDVGFPTRGNLHFAGCSIVVHPDHRRRGIGTALLEFVIKEVRAVGRTDLTSGTHIQWDGGPARSQAGAKFAERHGFKLALTVINRRCAVDALDPAEEERLWQEARAAAGDDYELVSWIGRTPDEYMDTICRIDSTILEEVPLGELDLEPEHVDADLKNAKADRREAMGGQIVQTIAVDPQTREAVANTCFFLQEDEADIYQGITIVDPKHRGHRLGTLVKIANLQLLRENFPHARQIWTDNADVNAPMININQRLGYEIVDAVAEYQIKLGS
jgi:GNAT superfamily N-acetyltransferase